MWLSDGVDIGRATNFVDGLDAAIGNRPLTVIDGGITPAHALPPRTTPPVR